MSSPRLEIDLNKIYHNARELVTRLTNRAITVTGVTKAVMGSVEVAETLLRAGVQGLGDARIENIKSIRETGANSRLQKIPMSLLRPPMLSQVPQIVEFADISFNTELEIVRALSLEATRLERTHLVILMVELGDLREGIMPEDLVETVREIIELPYIRIIGIGTNLACQSGVAPDDINMTRLSELADLIESTFKFSLQIVSGGNSANLSWALDQKKASAGRINNLRLGESILLGRETLHRHPIAGLFTDAITLYAEVIESRLKPSQPTGQIGQTAFGEAAPMRLPGTIRQAILAIGRQDVDPSGLAPPDGVRILGASSDQLVVQSDRADLFVGQELKFQINYSALLRAMTSPYVMKVYSNQIRVQKPYCCAQADPAVS